MTQATSSSIDDIASLRIELCDSEPLIWREAEVPVGVSLRTVHRIVQAAMGWENRHSWDFIIGGNHYVLPPEDG